MGSTNELWFDRYFLDLINPKMSAWHLLVVLLESLKIKEPNYQWFYGSVLSNSYYYGFFFILSYIFIRKNYHIGKCSINFIMIK